MLVIKKLTVAIDFQNTMEVNGGRELSGDQHSSKYLLLRVNRRKILIQVWNNMRVS